LRKLDRMPGLEGLDSQTTMEMRGWELEILEDMQLNSMAQNNKLVNGLLYNHSTLTCSVV
jgi:hypothetical protein